MSLAKLKIDFSSLIARRILTPLERLNRLGREDWITQPPRICVQSIPDKTRRRLQIPTVVMDEDRKRRYTVRFGDVKVVRLIPEF